MGLFTPSLAFDRVVVKYIGALKIPASILVELVVEELQRTVRELLEKVSWRFFFADSISSPSLICRTFVSFRHLARMSGSQDKSGGALSDAPCQRLFAVTNSSFSPLFYYFVFLPYVFYYFRFVDFTPSFPLRPLSRRDPTGVRIGLFTPDRAFYQVCESQIRRLREPAVKLVDLVTQELISVFRDTTGKVKEGEDHKEEGADHVLSRWCRERRLRLEIGSLGGSSSS